MINLSFHSWWIPLIISSIIIVVVTLFVATWKPKGNFDFGIELIAAVVGGLFAIAISWMIYGLLT